MPGAVDEVGGPTILATFTVIAALLPMAFVSGLMGPYMSPIPINASMGMLISLAVAFMITPWLAVRLLPSRAHAAAGPGRLDLWLASSFTRLLTPFVAGERGGRRRKILGAGILVAILASVSLAVVQLVVLKMLPFDNKSELQVIVDMPAGTPVEATAAALADLGAAVATLDEVIDYQAYAGTAAPINFNGLVRQYDLRQLPEQGDLQVNLVDQQASPAPEPRDRTRGAAGARGGRPNGTMQRSRSSRFRRGRRCFRRSSPKSTDPTRRGGMPSPSRCGPRSGDARRRRHRRLDRGQRAARAGARRPAQGGAGRA